VRDVAIQADLVFVAADYQGLRIYSLADRENPLLVGSYDPDYVRGVAVAGDHAFVAVHGDGLHVVDIADIANPTLVGFSGAVDEARGVAVFDQYVAVADFAQGLVVFDVSDPTTPLWLSHLSMQARSVTMAGDLAYVTLHQQLLVCDLSDPVHPAVVGGTFLPGDIGKAFIAGDFAYVTAEEAGFHVVSVADPGQPQLVTTVPTPAANVGLAVREDRAYLGCKRAGLAIYGVENPAVAHHLATVGGGHTGWVEGVALGSDFVAMVGSNDLGVGWLQCEETTAIPPGSPSPRRELDAVAVPNPFNPQTTVSFSNPAAGRVRAAVYDLAGRELRVLHEGALDAGAQELVWQGRDGRGRALPTGVYLVRIETPRGTIARKVALLR
jgi:hypothetical protein